MLDVGDFRLTQTVTQTGQKRDGRNRKIPVNAEFFHLKYVHIIIKIQKNTNGWLLTCMGSQVRVLYCPPDKNLEAATVSPHRYTMCHRGTVGTGKSKTQTQMHEFVSCFYIRIELDRSNVDGRSFQAHPDKMPYFRKRQTTPRMDRHETIVTGRCETFR